MARGKYCRPVLDEQPADSTPTLAAQSAAVNEVPLLVDDFRTGLEPTLPLVSDTTPGSGREPCSAASARSTSRSTPIRSSNRPATPWMGPVASSSAPD